MNQKIKSIVLLLVFGLTTFSCVDVLDLNNTKQTPDTEVWRTETSADMLITSVYRTISDISQVENSRTQFYDSYSDLMKSTSWTSYNHNYNRVLLEASAFATGSAGAFECWSDVYVRIRRANVIMDEIKRFGVPNFGEDWCNIRRAEVRLCRAISYYRLIRVYGGVIIRTDVSGADGSLDNGANPADVHKKRETEADSWNFVLSELQWAADHLPDEWTKEWTGRATKKTAYGFISRMALYAKKWQIAADAAEKVAELGGELAPNYAKVFQVEAGQDNSKELLFALYYLKGSKTHTFDQYNRPIGDKAVHGYDVYAEHVPTAELADLYEFSNGEAFSWSTWSLNNTDPFTNREPRFHATILANGSKWEGRVIQSFLGPSTSENGTDAFVAFTRSGSTGGNTCTGYYLRKYLQEGNDFEIQSSYQYDAVLRYAEVLLNKAEAYAELDYGSNREKALAALNEVRDRVNLPLRTVSEASNKEDFMTLLRRERCVELAGEGFRYWDLRRWRFAESVINGQNAHGVKITKNSVGNLSYERVSVDGVNSDGSPVSQRVFLERYYYFSLPTSELSNNNLALNNDWW